MPAPIIQHLTDNHRVICLTIEDWRNIYGMSPIKPDSVRALDKVPPTLQYVTTFRLCLFAKSKHTDALGPWQMVPTAGCLKENSRLGMMEELG